MSRREVLHNEMTLEQLQREVGTLTIFPLEKTGLAIVQPTAVPEIGVLIFLNNKEINSLTWVRFRSGQNGDSRWSVPFSVACLCGKCSIEAPVNGDQDRKESIPLIQVLEAIEQTALEQNLKGIVVDSQPQDILFSRVHFLRGINDSYLERSLEEFAQRREVSTRVIFEQMGFVTGTIGKPFKQPEIHQPLSCAA